MRSFTYLTLLPIFFVSTFAGSTPNSPHDIPQTSELGSGLPQDNPQDQELGPSSLRVDTQRSPPGSPSPGSPQWQSSPLYGSAPGMSNMVMHGFKCQKTLYELKEIKATVKRACNMYFNKKKTVGVTRYPMISKDWEDSEDSEDDKNFKIVFPLSSGSYFGWRAPGNHFVRMDPRCSSAEVVYQVRQKPQQASKHWCRLPNCFARGGKIYNSCTLLWERSYKGREYFNIHRLDLLLPSGL